MQHKLTREHCRQFLEEHLFTPKALRSSEVEADAIGSVGLELETFPFFKDSKHRFGVAPIPLFGREFPLADFLSQVAVGHGGKVIRYTSDPSIATTSSSTDKIVFPDGDLLQFEPGGQIEISTAPCNTIAELQAHLDVRKAMLGELTTHHQVHFGQFGTNPWFTVGEIGNQLSKPRYRALEDYFDRLGPYGKQMMLQTGSLHINLDLGTSRTKAIKRIVAANLLVPFVTAIFAHSPFIAGNNTGHKAYRSFLWQHLDVARTGILPISHRAQPLDFNALLDAYLDLALSAPVIYIPALDNRVFSKEVTMEYWMANGVEGVWPGGPDFENHVSLLFPEVRLKGYLEIRSVDAPPKGWEMVPVCFYCGLLYSDSHLDQVLEILLPLAPRIQALFEAATFGFDSEELFILSRQLVRLALDGFDQLPGSFKNESHQQQFISFYEQFTSQRRTFADGFLDTMNLQNSVPR
jgi:glutamate--cysteine ligase